MNPFDPNIEFDHPIIAATAWCVLVGAVYLAAFELTFAWVRSR